MKKTYNVGSFARINVKGLNLTNLINSCVNEDITLLNLDKRNSREIEFSLSDKDLKKFRKINTSNLEVNFVSSSLKNKFIHFLIYRMGLIIGVVTSFIFMFFMQNRLFNINIYGNTNLKQGEIVEKIYDFGIKKFSKMNFSKQDLENYLTQSLNLSFVSVITKGNTLIINVKEELPDISESYLPITAEYNMIIKDIKVFSGTGTKKVGDIVYAGDVLVEPYEILSGDKLEVTPCAEIKGEVFFSENYKFYNEEEVTIKTGKTKVIESDISLGKIKIFKNSKENTFENFEIIEKNSCVSTYFLPINIKKVVAYETKKEIVPHNFDEEKEKIIDDLKAKVYKKVPTNCNIESEDIRISSTNYGNIVTIYLKSSVYLKYEK